MVVFQRRKNVTSLKFIFWSDQLLTEQGGYYVSEALGDPRFVD